MRRAKTEARRRLARASLDCSIEDVLQGIGICPSDMEKARRLIEIIPMSFDMEGLVLPADLMLVDAMRVSLPIPSKDVDEKWVVREPFTWDLLENLYPITSKKLWEKNALLDAEFPTDESALADFVMEMTVGEFVVYFLKLMED